MITTGDTRVFRFWDTERELKAFEIPTGVDCSVTCLDSTYSSISHEKQTLRVSKDDSDDEGLSFSSDYNSNIENKRVGLVVAGFANGTVRVYDRRCSPNDARIKLWMDHTTPVLGVTMRDNKIVCGR